MKGALSEGIFSIKILLYVDKKSLKIPKGQATGKLYHLRLPVECTFVFVIYKAGRNPHRIGDRLV